MLIGRRLKKEIDVIDHNSLKVTENFSRALNNGKNDDNEPI